MIRCKACRGSGLQTVIDQMGLAGPKRCEACDGTGKSPTSSGRDLDSIIPKLQQDLKDTRDELSAARTKIASLQEELAEAIHFGSYEVNDELQTKLSNLRAAIENARRELRGGRAPYVDGILKREIEASNA